MLHAKAYTKVGTPVVAVKNIGDNRLVDDDIPRVDQETALRLERYRLLSGDIVFGRKGAVDRRALVKPEEEGWLQGSDCIRLRLNQNKIQPRFISFVLGSAIHRAWFNQQAHGATMPSLNQEILSRLPLPIPPYEEQGIVAGVLGTLDDKVELNRKMNDTLESMARALFKSWFVDFDPVRAKAEGRDTGLSAHIASLFPDSFEDSALGEIPAGWRATTLGAEAKQHGGRIQTGPFGSQLHASDYSAEGVPVVMPQDIADRRVSTVRIARINEADAQRLARHRLETGDIIYSRRGDVERHAQISAREVGWLCGTGCLLVRMGPQWPTSMFMSLLLDRPESRAWITQHAIGATMPNLNTGILSAIPLVVPPDDLLRAFARLAEPIEQGISARNAEAHSLEMLRDALLPKLISGELRVPQADHVVEAYI
jgi:type I restriction enzyme S subunit